MAGPCTEKCQLAEDAAVIKAGMEKLEKSHSETQKIVGGMSVKFGRMSQKLEDYMDRGEDEHKALFKRTSGVVKWVHLAGVIAALGTIIGITVKLVGG
jgi:hypothetical protein